MQFLIMMCLSIVFKKKLNYHINIMLKINHVNVMQKKNSVKLKQFARVNYNFYRMRGKWGLYIKLFKYF